MMQSQVEHEKLGAEVLNLGRDRSATQDVSWTRALDRILGAGLFVAACPVMAVLGIAAYALSGRAPFVAHRRIREDGRPFWMLKLRTMWPRGGSGWRRGLVERVISEGCPPMKPQNDPRVSSPFASFCRKYSLDELPQLWHVVTGEMSLVGPRPLTALEIEEHYGDDARELLSMKPGLTGLWQVSGRNDLDYRQRRTLDLMLVRNYSLGLYLGILLRTVPSVLAGRGAR